MLESKKLVITPYVLGMVPFHSLELRPRIRSKFLNDLHTDNILSITVILLVQEFIDTNLTVKRLPPPGIVDKQTKIIRPGWLKLAGAIGRVQTALGLVVLLLIVIKQQCIFIGCLYAKAFGHFTKYNQTQQLLSIKNCTIPQ